MVGIDRAARVREFAERELGYLAAQNQLMAMQELADALGESEHQLRRAGGPEWNAAYLRWTAQQERCSDFIAAYPRWFATK